MPKGIHHPSLTVAHAAAILALALAACEPRPEIVAPSGHPDASAAVGQQPCPSREYRAICLSESELIAEVAANEGRVFIGIAPPGWSIHPLQALRERRWPQWDTLTFAARVDELEQAVRIRVRKELWYTAVVSAEIDPALIPALRRIPFVWYVEPMYPAYRRWGTTNSSAVSTMQQSTEAYPNLTASQLVDWGKTSVGAPTAWSQGYRGQGLKVGVVDGRVFFDHPDLRPNWRVTGSWFSDPQPPYDGHGTWVAGALAAADNGFGTVGVANQAFLWTATVCDQFGCPRDFILSAINWFSINGVHVINVSLGGAQGTCLVTEHNSLQTSVSRGSVVVVAGGEGTPIQEDRSPYGCYDEVDEDGNYDPPGIYGLLSISAHDVNGEPTLYSWYDQPAQDLSVGGPGGEDQDTFQDTNPYSTFVAGQILALTCGDFSGDGYGPCMGTSMAAPHAAGIAALIRQEQPWLTPGGVETQIENRRAAWPCNLRQPCGSRSPSYPHYGVGKVHW